MKKNFETLQFLLHQRGVEVSKFAVGCGVQVSDSIHREKRDPKMDHCTAPTILFLRHIH